MHRIPCGSLIKAFHSETQISNFEINSFPADLKVVKADFVPPLRFLGTFQQNEMIECPITGLS